MYYFQWLLTLLWILGKKTEILSGVDKLPSTAKEDLRKISPNVLSRIETLKNLPVTRQRDHFLPIFPFFT